MPITCELNPALFADPYLPHFPLNECEARFKEKGGTLHLIQASGNQLFGKVTLADGDRLHPICSGGHCRSQALYCLLREQSGCGKMELCLPHASRRGYDPYHGSLPVQNEVPAGDRFEQAFGHPRIERFGFREMEKQLKASHRDSVALAKSYFDKHFYGKKNPHGRRLYLAFAHPVHAVLKRLIEANESLQGVWLVALPLKDEITHPPEESSFSPGSCEAYQSFIDKLRPIFHLES